MSLDVHLIGPVREVVNTCYSCGHTHVEMQPEQYFWSNITHNLCQMAEEAGIYDALWRPEEVFLTKASQLIPLLEEGLSKLKANPSHYSQFNAKNGWGTYDQFIPWIAEYLEACKQYPDAEVSVSR